MEIINFKGVDNVVYGTAGGANSYIAATPFAALWEALETSAKNIARIQASNLLERQVYCGAPTEPVDKSNLAAQPADTQPLQFPRTGLTDGNDVAIDETSIPYQMENASYDLAAELATDPSSTLLTSNTIGETGVRRIRSVRGVDVLRREDETEFFASASSITGASNLTDRFPLTVMEWIGIWICGAGAGIDAGPEIPCDETVLDPYDYGYGTGGLP